MVDKGGISGDGAADPRAETQSAGKGARNSFLIAIGVLLAGTLVVIVLIGHVSDLARDEAVRSVTGRRTGSLGMARDGGSLTGSPARTETLRLAVTPVLSPEASLPLYEGIVAYVADELGMSSKLILRANYSEVQAVIRDSRCDFAFVCTYPMVRAKREFGAEVLVVPVVDGVVSYNSYIIVRRDNPAENLLALRGKRFAASDTMSTSGWLYPAVWLLDRGEVPETFFSKITYAGSHDRAVMAVVEGDADGAAVHSTIYEQMSEEVRAATRVIDTSPPYGSPPVVAPPGLDPGLSSRVKSILLGMHEDERGRAVLAKLEIDRFVLPKVGLYDNVEKLANRWEESR